MEAINDTRPWRKCAGFLVKGCGIICNFFLLPCQLEILNILQKLIEIFNDRQI